MIKIYNANDKTYLSNGNITIMPLKCIEIKNEGFDGWEVEVEVLPEYKDYIAQDNIIVVPTKSRGEQPFRIQNPEINTRVIKFKANHVAFDSEKYLIQDIYPQGLNGSTLLDWINTRTDRTSPFTVISDISNLGTARIIRKTLREAFLIAQEQVGGFFDFDKWQIKLLSSIGLDRGETIRYGKNLQGIRAYENWSNVCTKILPVGPDGITLPEIYLMSDVQYQEVYAKPVTFEINQVEGQEFTNDQLIVELRRLANEYLSNHKYPEIHYEIQADVDQTLDIGDTVYTVTKQIEVPTRVQGYVYDVNKKRVTKLIYGNFDRNVKRIFNTIKADIEHAIEIGVSANKLISDQTNLINQLGKLGHVYQDENEILVLDALPKEDAQDVLRINLGGIGFSHTGIEGPFTSAWTIDGNFNASFITAGIFNASLIKTGMIESPDGESYWNLDSGEINLNVTSLKILSKDVATKEDVDNISLLEGPQGIQGPAGADGLPSYTHIAYATNATGTAGFSITVSLNKTYIGMYVDSIAADSTDPTKYKWTLIKGADGTQGIQGPIGPDGQTSYLHIAYATNTNGTTGFSTTDSVGKTYIGQYTDFTSADSTNPALYSWTLIKGDPGVQGVQGPKGADGSQGPKGDTGTSVVSVAEYYLATSASSGVTTATAGWTTTMQAMTSTNKYLWNYEEITFSDGSKPKTIPVIIGVYGNTGNTGATGRAITSIFEYYLASSSASGVTRATAGWATTMQATTPVNKYLWNYEVVNWSVAPLITYVEPIVIGVQGDDGKAITSVDVWYYLSTSATALLNGTWSTTAPAWVNGKYMWSKVVTTYSTGSPTESTPACITGANGGTGSTGTGITSITEEYYLSTSKTAQAGGSWITTPPVWSVGKYMWTRSKIVYSNPTSTVYTTPIVDNSWEAVNLLETRVYDAEQKILPDKILQSVESSVYQNGSSILGTKADIELLDDQWTAEFSEMRTGGENLLPKSATMEDWVAGNGGTLDYINGWAYLVANGSDPYALTGVLLETGLTHVFSVDVWTDNIDIPSALRILWRKKGALSWTHYIYELPTNTLNWKRVDMLFTPAGSGVEAFEISVECYSATTGKMWYRRPQLEVGTKGSPWKPSPNEIYTGITKVDKDGVEVSVSNDSVKSRLAFDGLTVRDGNVILAAFGETGAVVPELSADIINNPNVIQLRNGITVEVGSGKQYSSINAAISSLFHDGTRFLNGSVTLNIFGPINEIVDIRNLFGGSLNLVFFTGAVLYGRIFITNCTTQVNILSNTISNPSLKGVIRPPSGTGLGIEIENCSYVYVSDINMAGSSSYQAIRIMKGGVVFVRNCDFAGFSDTAILAGSGSLAMMSDNVGSNLGYAGWAYQGGRVYATGKIPTSTNGIQADKGFVWLIGTTAYPSEFSPPAITAKVFTQTFTTAVIETLVHGTTNVDSYFGAVAAQNRWDSTTGYKDGRIRFGAEIFDFFNGGTNVTVQMRLRRKNSTHGNSGAVLPAPYNHSASFPSGATRGGWTGWATISSSYFTSGGASLTYYNGVSGINGYAIWDAVEVWVQVTKNV